jgi:hypothetical protein
LQEVLRSLTRQRFENFEVIVCDNPMSRPVPEVVADFRESRFRYVRAPRDLSAPENWNYGCEHAQGEFVMVLSDKFALSYDCLTRFEAVRHSMPARIYSWYQEQFYLGDDTDSFRGTYYRWHPTKQGPAYYDLRHVLAKRLSFDCPRGTDGRFYCLGKMLCFGVYHRSLVEEIKQATGALFHPLAPEYSTMTAACILEKGRAVDLGVAGTVGIIPKVLISTGMLMATNPAFARGFLESMVGDFDRLLLELPVPGLYQSAHNIVAYTMGSICKTLAYPLEKHFNRRNLLELCLKDIEMISWPDEAAKQAWITKLQDLVAAEPVHQGPESDLGSSVSVHRWSNEASAKLNDIEESLEVLMQRVDQTPP